MAAASRAGWSGGMGYNLCNGFNLCDLAVFFHAGIDKLPRHDLPPFLNSTLECSKLTICACQAFVEPLKSVNFIANAL